MTEEKVSETEPLNAQSDSTDQGKEETTGFEPIRIDTHRGLVTERHAIFQRFNENPELSTLILINPVLAFREVGVEMTQEVSHHVFHTLQHTPAMRQRREELEAKLKKAIGEAPQANDPEWVSKYLFEKLGLQPLDTSGYEPEYRSPLNAEAIERLQALRPKRRQRYSRQRRSFKPGVVRVKTWRPAVRRLDLDAKLPELQPATETPKTVSLEALYFYKSHPLVRDLLELGIIARRGFPFHTGSSYRDIRDGLKPNAFRAWIRSVRFPEGRRK
jgi:hypothetical protein